MNTMTKSRDSRKQLLAIIASFLACFALVLALVPVQAIADDGEGTEVTEPGTGNDNTGDGNEGEETPGTNPTPEIPGGTEGEDEGDTPSTELKTTKAPSEVGDLVYCGSAQLIALSGEGYRLVPQEQQGQTVQETTTGLYATNAGTYTVSLELKSGYKWEGGGTDPIIRTTTIAPYDISQKDAATFAIPEVTIMDEAVTPNVTIKTANGLMLVQGNSEDAKDFTVTYQDNDKPGTAYASVTAHGNFTGEKVVPFTIVDNQVMYRLYNPNSGEHFYTASEYERDHLIKVGWSNEGIGWYAPKTSSAPVYRLYNPNAGEHLYTMNAGERDALVREGWNNEGIGWYSDTNETVKVLRQYNPNAYANNHNYTTSQYEFDYNIKLGWNDEGIAWYAAAAK